MFKPLLTAIFSIFIIPVLWAQATFSDKSPLFIDTVIPRVDIP